jgi:hypothetical protein
MPGRRVGEDARAAQPQKDQANLPKVQPLRYSMHFVGHLVAQKFHQQGDRQRRNHPAQRPAIPIAHKGERAFTYRKAGRRSRL